MSIQTLKNKKEELENFFDLSTIKPTKFLKLIKDEIIFLDAAYSKVEQIELIKAVFGIEINYNTYFQYFNKYCKTKSKNRSNKNVKSESNKNGSEDKEVVPNEDIKSSNETNIKNDKKIVSKKDENVNEEKTFSLFDDNSSIEKKETSIKKSNIKIVEDDITSAINQMNLNKK